MHRAVATAAAAVAAAAAAAGPASAQIFSHVGVLPVDNAVPDTYPACNFAGTIEIAGPGSVFDQGGDRTLYPIGTSMRRAAEIAVDIINQEQCGVQVGGVNLSLELTIIDDASVTDGATSVTRAITSTDPERNTILFGPYSSQQSGAFAQVADATNHLALAAGASSGQVFANRPLVFGTLPTNANYFTNAVAALKGVATKYAYIEEEGAPMCGYVEDLFALHPELQLVGKVTGKFHVDDKGNSIDSIEQAAETLQNADPDVIFTCIYDRSCSNFIMAMRKLDFNPGAVVLSTCAGDQSLVNFLEYPSDVEHLMGVVGWHYEIAALDAKLGYSARKFHQSFVQRVGINATYQAVSAAGAISLIAQAIEMANSTDPDAIADVLRENSFETMYGSISFDENRQRDEPYLLVQYRDPEDIALVDVADSNAGELIYPMPTWAQRDCIRGSNCSGNGVCMRDGVCECFESFQNDGPTVCTPELIEDPKISMPVKIISLIMFSINVACALAAIIWTINNRRSEVVLASQPVFLVLIAIGAIISSLTIVMFVIGDEDDVEGLAVDGEYWPANFACRAMVFTYTAGFVLTFAPLFAKLWRVHMVMKVSKSLKPIRVRRSAIFCTLLLLLALDMAICTFWTIQDPLKYRRTTVKTMDDVVFTAGRCESDGSSVPFIIAILVFHLAMLLAGTWLCYKTRNINSIMSESQYIAVAMISNLQVLVVAAPVLVIVATEPVANMFIRSAVVFLNDFGVLMLIFIPKWRALQEGFKLSTASISGANRVHQDETNESKRTSLATLEPTTFNQEP